jgi:hypothetical protein
MATKKSLPEKLSAITTAENIAVAAIRSKHSGLRAAELFKANGADLIAAGIPSIADHPDVKAALASKAAPKPDAAGAGEGKKRGEA